MKRIGTPPPEDQCDSHADHIHLAREEANYLRILLEATIAQAKEKVKEVLHDNDGDDTANFIAITLASASVDKARAILERITNPCDCL